MKKKSVDPTIYNVYSVESNGNNWITAQTDWMLYASISRLRLHTIMKIATVSVLSIFFTISLSSSFFFFSHNFFPFCSTFCFHTHICIHKRHTHMWKIHFTSIRRRIQNMLPLHTCIYNTILDGLIILAWYELIRLISSVALIVGTEKTNAPTKNSSYCRDGFPLTYTRQPNLMWSLVSEPNQIA